MLGSLFIDGPFIYKVDKIHKSQFEDGNLRLFFSSRQLEVAEDAQDNVRGVAEYEEGAQVL